VADPSSEERKNAFDDVPEPRHVCLKQMDDQPDDQSPTQAGQDHACREQHPVPEGHMMLACRPHENRAGHTIETERGSKEEGGSSEVLTYRFPCSGQQLVQLFAECYACFLERLEAQRVACSDHQDAEPLVLDVRYVDSGHPVVEEQQCPADDEREHYHYSNAFG
jgi:hypothetical protein